LTTASSPVLAALHARAGFSRARRDPLRRCPVLFAARSGRLTITGSRPSSPVVLLPRDHDRVFVRAWPSFDGLLWSHVHSQNQKSEPSHGSASYELFSCVKPLTMPKG